METYKKWINAPNKKQVINTKNRIQILKIETHNNTQETHNLVRLSENFDLPKQSLK